MATAAALAFTGTLSMGSGWIREAERLRKSESSEHRLNLVGLFVSSNSETSTQLSTRAKKAYQSGA